MSNPLRLGVAGLGVVGTSLVRLLQRQSAGLAMRAGRELTVAAYSARRKDDRGVDLGGAVYFADPAALAASADIDVFVELIGGADGAAFDAVKAALSRGVSVVTANKAMLAAHGFELAAVAERSGAQLFFEAAVGGGIPVIKTLRESLAGNAIQRVSGILNGTCNYILSRMETENLAVRGLSSRGPEAWLCGGRSDIRRRRLRHRAQARHPRLACFRRQDRRGRGFGRRHRDQSRSPT